MTNSFRDRLSDGRRALAHLIHIWHEMNGWSHKVLPALAEALDLGRVHNSQISNLRNGKLSAPGPEVFLALSQSNALLYKGLHTFRDRLQEDHSELLKVLTEGSAPLIRDDGSPIGAGEFFEIFVGLAPLPVSFNWFIEDHEASLISASLSDYLSQGKPWRQCREKVMGAYPVQKSFRRERFESVMAGLNDYSAEELEGELMELYETYSTITGIQLEGPNQFLENLRAHYLNLNI